MTHGPFDKRTDPRDQPTSTNQNVAPRLDKTHSRNSIAFRALSLTGGGLLGVISAAMLERFETLGRARYGSSYCLADSFDFVGGTSTGAVLATAVALGMPAVDMVNFYLEDSKRGIKKRRFFLPGVTPIYNSEAMLQYFQAATQNRIMQRDNLKTDLGIVVKSLSYGQPVLSTSMPIPGYREKHVLGARVSTAPLCLSRLLMASTAVTGLFSPQKLALDPEGEVETCVDGGLSAYNDPTHLLYSFIRSMQAANLCNGKGQWLEMVSGGTGSAAARSSNHKLSKMTAVGLTLKTMNSMVADSVKHTKGTIRELASHEALKLSYVEHDMTVTAETFRLLGLSTNKSSLLRMRSFLSVDGKRELYEAAKLVAERQIQNPLSIIGNAPLLPMKTVA